MFYTKRFIFLFSALILFQVIYAQRSLPRSGDDSNISKSGNTPDSIKEGSAWTLTFPLGNHVESKIDTLSYNYQRYALPALQSDAYATTGNLGAEGINMIFFERAARNTFFFKDALDAWLPSFHNQKFYNVYIPSSILQYGFAGGNLTHQDRLRFDLMGNVNRKIGIGGKVDYLYSKGEYENQATKDLSFGFSLYYTGNRYEAQAFYNHYNFLNKENGGITNDLYITDPAQVQAGVTTVNTKNIPTRLTAAHTRIAGDEFFMTHAFKMGYWKTETIKDTVQRDIYIPLAKIIYSFDLQHSTHRFLNSNTTEGNEFWENRYLDLTKTNDMTYLNMMTNSIGLEMIEGFRKWVKFGLSAYASYQIQKYHQATYYTPLDIENTTGLTPLPNGMTIPASKTKNFLWIGGSLHKDKGNILKYVANVKFGLVGDVVGDLELDGNISTKFKLFGDSVKITARGEFSNKAQPYLLQQYISNHFVWNNDFGKTRRYLVSGSLLIPWTKTTLSAGVENLQNYVFFNGESLPQQFSGNIQIFSASLNQELRIGILNWNNTIYYQKTSKSDILPLPELTIYSNLFLKFIAFKVLKLQIGLDCDYYTSYNGLDYQPATMSFHVQGADKVKIGNYPLINVYINARLYKTRFYIQYSHLNQGWFSKNYFLLPHYPMNPRRLEFGLSIDFTN